jgi:hypothetical protein
MLSFTEERSNMIQPKLRLAGYTLGSIQGRKELNGGIVARETTYPDTGCKRAKTLGYYGDCIHCPFEECFELGENIYRKHITKKRNNEIKEAWLNGVPVTTIMTKYHVSSDTVQSIIES